MAHILEAIRDKTSVINSEDVIHWHISNLLARMYDYEHLVCKTDEEKDVIEGWRNELTFLRGTLDRINRKG